MYNPLVSIIIPVFNGSNYLARAIDSALNQTYKNIEVLVINDGSNDNGKTESIINGYGDKIRYYSKQNGGVSSALNMGIMEMKGEYFSWLSHDDEYTHEKIESQIEVLKKADNKTTIAYCSSVHINKDSQPLKTLKKNTLTNQKNYNWDEVLLISLKKGTFNGCAFLIHKSVFLKCGMFDESLRYNQDSFMLYKIFLNKYNLMYSSYVGVMSRLHNAQLSQTARELFQKDCERMSAYLILELIKISTKRSNFLLEYTKSIAKYRMLSIVKTCIENGMKTNLLSKSDIMKIHIALLYGIVRPFIRRIYHKIFTKVSTK